MDRGQTTLTIILSALALLLLAQWLIPGASLPPEEWARVIYLLGFLALLGGGVVSRKRIGASKALTYGGIWAIIILSLMIGYQLWQRHVS